MSPRACLPAIVIVVVSVGLGTTAAAQVTVRPAEVTQAERLQPDQALAPLVRSGVVWKRVRFDDARTQPRPRRSLLADIAGDYCRFVTAKETYEILAVGLGGALGSSRLDGPIANSPFNEHLNAPSASWVDGVFEPGSLLGGGTFQLSAALSTYGLGSWLDMPGVAEVGRDLVRAQVLAQGVTHLLKRTVQRTRPDGSSTRSFPSGHTSGIFATATVLGRHYGWKVGGPAYGVAAYVAASRLNENRHYLSDVVFGAAIGLAAGRTVTFGLGETRVQLSPLFTPGGGGVSVSVTR